MEDKVYCKLCKHKKYIDLGFYSEYECKANPKYFDDYYNHHIINEECRKKNKNNDCQDYEAKRSWFELINFIRFPII